jgi:TonB family protein
MRLDAAALTLLLATSAAPQTPPAPLQPVGPTEPVTVCGIVETFSCAAGDLTLKLQQSANAEILIPVAARGAGDRRLEERYVDREVCATGRAERTATGDRVTVERLNDVTIRAESPRLVFAPHAYRSGCDADLVLPKLVRDRKPAYTRLAMTEGVQGTVWLETVVEANGEVGEARVVKSLRGDLDEQAILAAKEWRFAPATYNGSPVAAIVTIEMTFTLKSN